MPSAEVVCNQFRLTWDANTPMPLEIPRVTRLDFARWLGEWDLDRGVEVGTYAGEFAETLLTSNPNLHLTCVDPWRIYSGYTDYMRQTTLERAYETACERLAPHYGRCSIVRNDSVHAAPMFKDGFFDFVYIDGNHMLPHVVADIAAWTPKVRIGGIIAGHDYVRRFRWPHVQVVQAVNAWTDANQIRPWFVTGRKREPKQWMDPCRTWFWVRQQ